MDLSLVTADLLTSLPVERRAVELLRAITAGEDKRSSFFQNRRNVLLTLQQRFDVGLLPEEGRAYEEAFDWLKLLHGLVAREPSQNGDDWFFVTDRGWDIAESDSALADIAIAGRLAQNLHPRIAERVRNQLSRPC